MNFKGVWTVHKTALNRLLKEAQQVIKKPAGVKLLVTKGAKVIDALNGATISDYQLRINLPE